MRNRRAYILFPTETGRNPSLFADQKKIEGVNIRFSATTYSPVGVAADAHISIYNLNKKDLGFLTTTPNSLITKQNLIQLYAGYDDNIGCLFSGMITEAPPTGNPDVSIDIKGLAGLTWMAKPVQIQRNNVTVADLIDDAGKTANIPVNIPAPLRNANEWLNKTLESFSYTGTSMGLIQKISSMIGGPHYNKSSINLSIYNDGLYAWSAGDSKNSILLINEKSGMVGYPRPTAGGAEVTILLNPGIKAGDIVRIESNRIPQCTGNYFVVGIKHQGELRGNTWYTTLTCSFTSNWGCVQMPNMPLNINPFANDFMSFLEDAIKKALYQVQTCIPAIVKKVESRDKVIVIPAIQQTNRAGEAIEWADISLPVHAPFGAGILISCPLAVGDTGWIIAGDLDPSRFFKDLTKPTTQNTFDRHDYQFGFFIPDKIKGYKIDADDKALFIGTPDGKTKITITDGAIEIASGNTININSSDVSINGINWEKHTHIIPAGVPVQVNPTSGTGATTAGGTTEGIAS